MASTNPSSDARLAQAEAAVAVCIKDMRKTNKRIEDLKPSGMNANSKYEYEREKEKQQKAHVERIEHLKKKLQTFETQFQRIEKEQEWARQAAEELEARAKRTFDPQQSAHRETVATLHKTSSEYPSDFAVFMSEAGNG